MEITVSEFGEAAKKIVLMGKLDITGAEKIELPLATLAGRKTTSSSTWSGWILSPRSESGTSSSHRKRSRVHPAGSSCWNPSLVTEVLVYRRTERLPPHRPI